MSKIRTVLSAMVRAPHRDRLRGNADPVLLLFQPEHRLTPIGKMTSSRAPVAWPARTQGRHPCPPGAALPGTRQAPLQGNQQAHPGESRRRPPTVRGPARTVTAGKMRQAQRSPGALMMRPQWRARRRCSPPNRFSPPGRARRTRPGCRSSTCPARMRASHRSASWKSSSVVLTRARSRLCYACVRTRIAAQDRTSRQMRRSPMSASPIRASATWPSRP